MITICILIPDQPANANILAVVRRFHGRLYGRDVDPFALDHPGAEIYELLSCQELGQLADLASGWLLTPVQPIRSQLAC